MGNRHHNKKIRAEVRATMARTGESYQAALSRLRSERRSQGSPARDVDLIPVHYFGTPMTLATFQILGELSVVVMSGRLLSRPYPKNPLFALARRRTVN